MIELEAAVLCEGCATATRCWWSWCYCSSELIPITRTLWCLQCFADLYVLAALEVNSPFGLWLQTEPFTCGAW